MKTKSSMTLVVHGYRATMSDFAEITKPLGEGKTGVECSSPSHIDPCSHWALSADYGRVLPTEEYV